MVKKQFPFEFTYQVFALIVAIIIVHAIYVAVVRPNAEAVLTYQAEMMAQDSDYVADRSVWVLIRDFEQESCFILLFWAMAIMAYKAVLAVRERALLQQDLLHITEGMSVLPEDTRELSRPLQALPDKDRESLLPRALLTALHRFRSTRNIQDTSDAVRSVCESWNAQRAVRYRRIKHLSDRWNTAVIVQQMAAGNRSSRAGSSSSANGRNSTWP